MSDACIFCRIAEGDIPATVVHRDDVVVAFEDTNPQAPVHILIIPRQHIATINDLDEQTTPLIGRMVDTARRIALDRGIAEDGYRLVWNVNAGAGQTVFHVHLHLLGGRRLGWPPG
jgi:histidine triad (HIT) family protein